MTERLVEDHEVAAAIARELAANDGIDIDVERVQTNIVLFSLPRGIRPTRSWTS